MDFFFFRLLFVSHPKVNLHTRLQSVYTYFGARLCVLAF